MFGQFAIYRARRYRLTRTIWRGVRFWMDGSGWAYAWWAVLWGFLVVLTLGLLLPWRQAALERYKMQHSGYGDLEGHSRAKDRSCSSAPGGCGLPLRSPWCCFRCFPLSMRSSRPSNGAGGCRCIRFGAVRLGSKLERGAFIGL